MSGIWSFERYGEPWLSRPTNWIDVLLLALSIVLATLYTAFFKLESYDSALTSILAGIAVLVVLPSYR